MVKGFACNVGQGVVEWDKILAGFKDYNGYFSFEYEKRWYPDQLEDARTGVKACLEYVKKVMSC